MIDWWHQETAVMHTLEAVANDFLFSPNAFLLLVCAAIFCGNLGGAAVLS